MRTVHVALRATRGRTISELIGITTYLIERCHLPTLPPRLRRALRFNLGGRITD